MKCSVPTNTSPMQSAPKAQGELQKMSQKLKKTRTSVNNMLYKEAAHMNSQQHRCMNKINKMTISQHYQKQFHTVLLLGDKL